MNALVPFPSPPSPWTLQGAVCHSDYHTPCPVPANFSLSMCSMPQAAYPPAASMAQPPAMSRHPLSHVSSVRQVSTQVSHQVPHARRVGEFGQGQEEWGQGLLLGWASRESEPASTAMSLPFTLLESTAGFRGRVGSSPTDPVPGANSSCGLAKYCIGLCHL